MNISTIEDENMKTVFESLKNNSHWNIKNLQGFTPILEKCFHIKHREKDIKHIRLNNRYCPLECISLKDDDDVESEKGSLYSSDTENNNNILDNDNSNEGDNESSYDSDDSDDDDNSYNSDDNSELTNENILTDRNQKNFVFKILDTETGKEENRDVFVKICHLLDPLKYIRNEYCIYNNLLCSLPYLNNETKMMTEKIQDPNNKAYVDSFFCSISSKLAENDICPHFPIFYSQYVGISENYEFNLTEDFYSIRNEKEFHINVKDEYLKVGIIMDDKIKILTNTELCIETNEEVLYTDDDETLESDKIFEDFEKENDNFKIELDNMTLGMETAELSLNKNVNMVELSDIDDMSLFGMKNVDNNSMIDINNIQTTLLNDCKNSVNGSEYSEEEDDEYVEFSGLIKDFPVIAILQERCDGVLEELCEEITGENMEDSERRWSSYLFQIIFTLSILQYFFDFTHNDLHSNNIMYKKTDKEYLYYKIYDQYYRIPTFGYILKIIDFGRAIYKVRDRLFVSDDFKDNNDAGGQYNFPPYYNHERKQITPNKSFDLCRLSASIFETLYPERDNINKDSNLYKLLNMWLTDKNGDHILFNDEGEERYKGFDLYKAIAAKIESAVPEQQYTNSLFTGLKINMVDIPEGEHIYEYPVKV
jgi:hypothetical protein